MQNQKIHLAIVDDQEFHVKLVAHLVKATLNRHDLEDMDVHVHLFTEPYKLLKFAHKHPLDILLSDHYMPALSGLELMKKISQIHPQIYVIIITAEQDEKLLSDYLNQGATDLLNKPIKIHEFVPKLANLLKLKYSEKLLSDRAFHLEKEVEKAVKTIKDREEEIILRLARAAEFKDTDTGYHIERVALYSRLIAQKYGLSKTQCEEIYFAAPLHDVGKIAIPDLILKKPGKLTPEEWKIMQEHTTLGAKIFTGTKIHLLQVGATVAKYHHEKWNGLGYPEGLKGTKIPIEARIVAIADVFDALTTKRPYKDPWPADKAFDLIAKEKSKHFDPELAEVFLNQKEHVLAIKEKMKD